MKRTSLLLAILVLGAGTTDFLAQPSPSQGIEAVFDGYFRDVIARNPEMATQIGLTPAMGYPIANDRLTDVSEQAARELFAVNRTYLGRLKSFSGKTLTPAQRMAADALTWSIERTLEGEPYWWHTYVIDHMNGFHSTLTDLMTELHPIKSRKDADDYVSRLGRDGTKIDHLLATLAVQEKKGIIPPKVIVDTVLRELTGFVAVEPVKNVLATAFAEKIDRLTALPQADRDALRTRAVEVVATVVYPAYQRFIERLKPIAAAATTDMGVWRLPDGDKYYTYCLRYYTSTSLTPEQIHQLGLREMARLQQDVVAIVRSLGITGGTTFPEVLGEYRKYVATLTREQMAFPNTPEGKLAALEEYQRVIDVTTARLPQHFSLIPRAGVVAQRVPEFQERTFPSNYMPASLDGSRPGVFYVNLGGTPGKSGIESLTFHEAIPGHHFQIAIERESPDYRLFRSVVEYTGFMEGWALYAEQLGREFGWFSNAFTRMGHLTQDMGRAMRLVVDTGIHYKRWTREQALAYQRENYFGASPFEVDRYAVMPGQACAYMVGKLKILELRARAEKELGGKFDLKAFHKAVLEHGSLPLEMLERNIADHIQARRR